MLFVVFLSFGCKKAEEKKKAKGESCVSEVLKGEHKLRRLSSLALNESESSGGLFLFFGSSSFESNQKVFAYFSWEMNDGSYAISFLPIEKIRINLVEDQDCPTIKFRWRVYVNNYEKAPDLEKMMEMNIVYAVITLQGEDWPKEIDLR
jgi:hypothetical protein